MCELTEAHRFAWYKMLRTYWFSISFIWILQHAASNTGDIKFR